jgi:RimJ/RimL family protein N-acetyltransferase
LQYKSKVTRDIHEKIKCVRESCDVFKKYNIDYFLSGTGLAIHPDYRKHGIATEMLKSRLNIMDFFHLKLTSTRFSSIGSQKAATRCGFKEDHTIRFVNFITQNLTIELFILIRFIFTVTKS